MLFCIGHAKDKKKKRNLIDFNETKLWWLDGAITFPPKPTVDFFGFGILKQV